MQLPDGYGQSKWVAEQLALEAQQRGMPIKIYRVGTISGHSSTGVANAWDLLTALIVESIRIGHCPDVKGWRAEMTPVDFVAKAVVHFSRLLSVRRACIAYRRVRAGRNEDPLQAFRRAWLSNKPAVMARLGDHVAREALSGKRR
ncbi:hypothetical protein MRB53_040325 [Persea americana]|nr:hypothetical protein MRB53_040325 [Persea americana]